MAKSKRSQRRRARTRIERPNVMAESEAEDDFLSVEPNQGEGEKRNGGEDENEEESVVNDSLEDRSETGDGDEGDGEDPDGEGSPAEDVVWDALKEEFHDVIDQLPLYLHRQFALLRELDEQTDRYTNGTHENLAEYISVRERWQGVYNKRAEESAASSREAPSPVLRVAAEATASGHHDGERMDVDGGPSGDPSSLEAVDAINDVEGDQGPSTTEDTDTPLPHIHATRTTLSRLGWSVDEALRTSEEKVSLAQAIYDSVQRHIRQLDLAIKEQEMTISLGMRPGTHPALLEELEPPPRWQKPQQNVHELATESTTVTSQSATVKPSEEGSRSSSRRNRKGRTATAETADRTASGLKLKLKRPAARASQEISIDVEEELFCLCNKPSKDPMICCDNSSCDNGTWFHFECVGLKEPLPFDPEEATWYCPNCEPMMKTPRRRKRG